MERKIAGCRRAGCRLRRRPLTPLCVCVWPCMCVCLLAHTYNLTGQMSARSVGPHAGAALASLAVKQDKIPARLQHVAKHLCNYIVLEETMCHSAFYKRCRNNAPYTIAVSDVIQLFTSCVYTLVHSRLLTIFRPLPSCQQGVI